MRDRELLDVLNSSCPEEVRGELCNVAKKLVGTSYLFKVSLYCFYFHVVANQCKMRNYHKDTASFESHKGIIQLIHGFIILLFRGTTTIDGGNVVSNLQK